MQPADLNIDQMSVTERIQLAEILWDSVATDTIDLPLTDAQKTELDRRLAGLERAPDEGEPWSVVRARAENRLAQAG